ncbi:MAG: CvpA family protein [Chloroflexi bacterium]|nr:MAG: CvpA family protein [Chloroflexota bacterium]
MNWLDFAIIFVLIGFVAAAYAAGLIREAVTLVAAILGIVIAGLLYDDLAADILVFMDDEDAAQAISFLILVGAVYMFGQIIALMLSRTASLLMLGWADRAGGAVFGFLKGLLVVQALLIVLAAYPSLGMEDAVAGSQLAPYFVDDVDVLLWVLPDNFDSRIERFLAPQPPQSS